MQISMTNTEWTIHSSENLSVLTMTNNNNYYYMLNNNLAQIVYFDAIKCSKNDLHFQQMPHERNLRRKKKT